MKFWLWVMLVVFLIFLPALLATSFRMKFPNWIITFLNPMALVLMVILVLLAVAAFKIYFFPTTIAKKRNHPQKEAIFVLNLALGWTFVGWVIALVWANINQK